MTPPPDSHRSPGTASHDAARRLLDRELTEEPRVDASDARAVAEVGERLMLRVTAGLSRSFGAFGAVALVSRALTRAKAGHPVLAGVTIKTAPSVGVSNASDAPTGLAGLMAGAGAVGAPATVDGLTAWLAELADLLGELIGDDLATTLLAQGTESPRLSAVAPGVVHAVSAAGEGGKVDDAHHAHPRTVDER